MVRSVEARSRQYRVDRTRIYGGKQLLGASVEIDVLITRTNINVKRWRVVPALNRGTQNSHECVQGVLDNPQLGERGRAPVLVAPAIR